MSTEPTELKPKFWAILNKGIEMAFIPLEFAINEDEAVKYYRQNVLNMWQRERYESFHYEAIPVVSLPF